MNQNINQSSLRDKFRLTTRVRCFYMLFIYQFPLILGIIMGRVRFRGMHWARTTFSDRNDEKSSLSRRNSKVLIRVI